MRYLSVCSGIEAATVAWHPLGWRAAAFSEIEAFPRAVLAHHYPDTPCHGDFTTIGADDYGPIDLLVGGTPCQSFSVAGLRGGLDDDRGNLALEYLRLADRKRPRWLVWENVPGVLSSNGGRDFGAILGGMVELGYGFAYRVADAQHFGVPQRRRRGFVVGHLGDWRRAAAVLFERYSLSGDTPPRRQAGQGTAGTIRARTGISRGAQDAANGHMIPHVAGCIDTGIGNQGFGQQAASGQLIPEISHYLNAGGMGRQDYETETLIAHSLRAEGFDASEDGTGRGTPLVPVAIHPHCIGRAPNAGPQGKEYLEDGSAYTCDARGVPQAVCFTAKDYGADASDISPTLRSGGHDGSHANGGVMPAVAFAQNQRDELRMMDVAGALAAEPGMKQQTYIAQSAVRRLTPVECEKLQGFPPGYTAVPYRGKDAADGPRYRALGNSMAVPVMVFMGQRIQTVEDMMHGRDTQTRAA